VAPKILLRTDFSPNVIGRSSSAVGGRRRGVAHRAPRTAESQGWLTPDDQRARITTAGLPPDRTRFGRLFRTTLPPRAPTTSFTGDCMVI